MTYPGLRQWNLSLELYLDSMLKHYKSANRRQKDNKRIQIVNYHKDLIMKKLKGSL